MQPDEPSAIDPLELYASGIDTSDYVARVLPLLRDLVPEVGDLLDVGAGGGQLGNAFRADGREWAAIEPASSMRRRLERFSPPPRMIPSGWADAGASRHRYDTVLAANMPAPLNSAPAFLDACRGWTRRGIVWLVPAQNGPRGLCLAGCLPREWHGEDETPGVEIVLRQLPEADRPDRILTTEWSFRLHVRSVPAIASYLADRLGWDAQDPRRPAMAQYLAGVAEEIPGGHRLTVPRASAILAWTSAHQR